MTGWNWVRVGAVLGFLAVGFGAFGAHGLKTRLETLGTAATYQTAVQYHMYHALAILAVGLMARAVIHRIDWRRPWRVGRSCSGTIDLLREPVRPGADRDQVAGGDPRQFGGVAMLVAELGRGTAVASVAKGTSIGQRGMDVVPVTRPAENVAQPDINRYRRNRLVPDHAPVHCHSHGRRPGRDRFLGGGDAPRPGGEHPRTEPDGHARVLHDHPRRRLPEPPRREGPGRVDHRAGQAVRPDRGRPAGEVDGPRAAGTEGGEQQFIFSTTSSGDDAGRGTSTGSPAAWRRTG